MPKASPHGCADPSCAALVPYGVRYCADHAAAQDAAAAAQTRDYDRARGTATQRGYGAQWRKRRDLFLDLYPLCGMRPDGRAPVLSHCHDDGRLTPAYQVDHVVPHRGDPALFWDEQGNWQALCQDCGIRKTRAGL
jgi:5-methylcytosine-specific restriction enzyme A